ncbi:MAG: hypothetical protein K8R31_03730 [Bacteroidales bacterium]|nr:hypothetical protein [Bacteroidales bacterium]
MYKQKSKIIEQIQSYHKQVAQLYFGLYEKVENEEIKLLIYDLYQHEKFRESYLEKHKKIAKAMNCWLGFPSNKLSNQISECFKNIKTGPDLSMADLIKIELYFDNCLIKLYNILASENELNETMINIFYYMLKKTKKEETILAKMLNNSKENTHYKFTVQNI